MMLRNSRHFLTPRWVSHSALAKNGRLLQSRPFIVSIISNTFGHLQRNIWLPSLQVGNRYLSKLQSHKGIIKRCLITEAAYHRLADETLELIQESLEEFIESNFQDNENIPEVSYASGVLTITFPSHGSWVINKQTPNRQLWWSSPLSGPRRYEYDDSMKKWVYSRALEGKLRIEAGSHTLGGILETEIQKIYGIRLRLDV